MIYIFRSMRCANVRFSCQTAVCCLSSLSLPLCCFRSTAFNRT